MIDKETFLQIIKLIQEQDAIDKEVGNALEKISDTYVFFNTKNARYDALRLLLDKMHLYDYISWWLYEAPDGLRKVWLKDGTEIIVETPEQLYNYIKENYEDIKKASHE